MMSLCQYSRPLRVVMASDAWFDSVGFEVDGCYFCAAADGDDLLIIRESAVPTAAWYDVLAHEFAHALHGEIDRYVAQRLGEDATHRELVEKFVPLLGGLVQGMLKEEPAPDWSEAPGWAQWWAVDPDGYCHWFDNEPILTEQTSHRDIIGPHWSHYGSKQSMYDAINIPLGIDWRLLKQERPITTKKGNPDVH